MLIKKRLSLITTTRDRPEMLMNAGLSVAAQTVKPHQWIIYIDDDLPKYSKVLSKLTRLIDNLHVIGGKRVGRVKALDHAHKFVSGDFAGLLDDDDWLHEDCIYHCANTPGQIVYTDFYDCDETGCHESALSLLSYSFKAMKRTQLLFHFVAYNMELFNRVNGFDLSFDTTMDYELYLRMLLFTTPVKIDLPLYYVRSHPDTIHSREGKKKKKNHIRAVNKINEIFALKILE